MSKALLSLGCYGRQDYGFVSCNSIENVVLEITPKFEEIKDFLFYMKSLGLMEKKLNDYNAVRKVLFNIQDRYYQNYNTAWTSDYFRLMENFTLVHRSCGIYLKFEAL